MNVLSSLKLFYCTVAPPRPTSGDGTARHRRRVGGDDVRVRGGGFADAASYGGGALPDPNARGGRGGGLNIEAGGSATAAAAAAVLAVATDSIAASGGSSAAEESRGVVASLRRDLDASSSA